MLPVRHLRVPLASIALAILVAFVPASLSAQEPAPDTMVIEVPDPDQPEFLPGSTNREFFGERYAAFADGVLCVDGEVPEDGGFTIVLGEEGQPEECGTPGARVEFAGTSVGPFFFEATLSPGTTVTLTNWAPYPTDTPYPTHVCAWLGQRGETTPGCQVVGPPGTTLMWQFAPRFIFGDERAVIALTSLMDVGIEYGQPVAPANGDEILLLQAAGILSIDEELQLAEARACRIWYPSDPDAPGFVGIAETLTAELARVFEDLGLTISPCDRTTAAAEADLLLWREGKPPAVDFSAFTMDGSFLVSTFAPPPLPPGPGPARGDGPAPSDAGNAGLVAPSEDRAGEGMALLMLALVLAGALGARAIARR